MTLTPRLQEARARLATIRVPLDASSEGFHHALVAIICSSQGIELLWKQDGAANGEPAAIES
jgi:hypothetical protein